ncbi:MAG: hypothetical protein QM770_03815 [Tepidisphaeraceae bacterium]
MLAYGVLAVRFFMGTPTPSTDEVTRLNTGLNAVPESDRAWPLVEPVSAEMDKRRAVDIAQRAFDFDPDVPVDDPRWTQVKEGLQRNARLLDIASDIARKPRLGYEFGEVSARAYYRRYEGTALERFWRGWHGPMNPIELATPNTVPMNLASLTQLLAADGRLAYLDGDVARLDRRVHEILAYSLLIRETHVLYPSLLEVEVRARAVSLLLEALQAVPEKPTNQQLVGWAHALSGPKTTLDLTDTGTRRDFARAVASRLFTDDGHGDGRLTPAGLTAIIKTGVFETRGLSGEFEQWAPRQRVPMTALMPLLALKAPSRQEALAEFEMWMRRSESLLAGPYDGNAWLKLYTIADAGRGNSYSGLQHFLTLTFAGPAEWEARAASDYLIQRDQAVIAIALILYRREYGQWPESLDALVPAYLPSLPPDRIARGEAWRECAVPAPTSADPNALRFVPFHSVVYVVLNGKATLYADNASGTASRTVTIPASVDSH